MKRKIIYAENLNGCDDIVCEFGLYTFNLVDRVVNFSWLFICSLCAMRKFTVCFAEAIETKTFEN